MENSDKFFTLICECSTEFCPANTKLCPSCNTNKGKDLKFDIHGFLNKIYELLTQDKQDSAMDVLFDAFHNLWDRHDIKNDILGTIDVSQLNSTLLCGFMVQTFKYIDQIPNHLLLCDKAEVRMKELGMEDERINKLVSKYRDAGDYWKNQQILGTPEWLSGPKP